MKPETLTDYLVKRLQFHAELLRATGKPEATEAARQFSELSDCVRTYGEATDALTVH